MHIHCPNCDTPIPASGINIQDKLAVCPQCSSVFSFADLPLPRRKERKVKAPEGITVAENSDTLEIQFPWLRMAGAWGKIITVIFGLCLIFPGVAAVAAINAAHDPVQALVGVALGGVFLFFCYLFLMMLLDRQHITVGEDEIRVDYRPLPVWRSVQVTRGEVERVACATSRRSDHGEMYYGVQAVCRDGHEVLLTTLRREWALYIAQTLDAYLHPEPELEAEETADEEEDLPLTEGELPAHTLSARR